MRIEIFAPFIDNNGWDGTGIFRGILGDIWWCVG